MAPCNRAVFPAIRLRRIYGQLAGRNSGRGGRERFRWIQDEALSLHRRKGKLAVQTKSGPELLARRWCWPPEIFHRPTRECPASKPRPLSIFIFPGLAMYWTTFLRMAASCYLAPGSPAWISSWRLNRRGFAASFMLFSPRTVPRARRHVRQDESWPSFWGKTSPRSVRGLLRLIRRQYKQLPTRVSTGARLSTAFAGDAKHLAISAV